ncbi:Solute carrier family 35 member F2 [Dichanthelium oligosanthes]|uniref:Solute carrier family 35 member F2 n=1 Tax=Dichanthelium oligosanthes TaxID=888268 RepID=A0A1E5UZK5_9POAL|nr:Solute carrier family 35 member F2 [Dichanthelium oligosanthes]
MGVIKRKDHHEIFAGVDAPLTQLFFAYLLLTIVYVPIVLHRREKLQIAWYWYLALSFLDVQGNYLVVKAYQYSYITSVNILSCCTLVWVIILTWYALGTRYSLWQFVGSGACVTGLALALQSDAKSPNEQDPGKIPLLGDALVIAGTVCYAFNNVGQEYCVKNKDRVELVAMLGLFGSLISTVQMYPLHNSLLINLFAGFAGANFTFCSVTPFVLKVKNLLTVLFACNLRSESSSDDKEANIEAAAQYQQLRAEDNSTESGSNSGSQERTHNDEVHIC